LPQFILGKSTDKPPANPIHLKIKLTRLPPAGTEGLKPLFRRHFQDAGRQGTQRLLALIDRPGGEQKFARCQQSAILDLVGQVEKTPQPARLIYAVETQQGQRQVQRLE